MPRFAKIAVFAYGEADTENAFLKHIRAVYGRNTGVSVKIGSANGGSPEEILDSAIRSSSRIAYDCKFILLDTDVPWTEETRQKAKKNDIELLPAHPCIEGFFISLLEPGRKTATLSSSVYKKSFEKIYLTKEDKLDYRNYSKIFPKAKLETFRKTNPVLNRIISLMTIGNLKSTNKVLHK